MKQLRPRFEICAFLFIALTTLAALTAWMAGSRDAEAEVANIGVTDSDGSAIAHAAAETSEVSDPIPSPFEQLQELIAGDVFQVKRRQQEEGDRVHDYIFEPRRDWALAAAHEPRFRATNLNHELAFSLWDDGSFAVEPMTGGWRWSMRLDGLAPDKITGGGSAIEALRGENLVESFANRPDGIEHVVKLSSPPEGTRGSRLQLDFIVDTDLRAVLDDNAKGAMFIDERGTEVLHYSKLLVADVNGTTLPSRMELVTDAAGHPSQLSLVVDARAANYPIVIDPTFQVTDLLEAGFPSDGISNQDPVVIGGTVYFAADDGVHGTELWKSDGTAEGTVMVKDINPGLPSASIDQLRALGNIVVFAADDGVLGTELWRSDGTEAGTFQLADIMLGEMGSFPTSATVAESSYIFAAESADTGSELWKTDGTVAGTMLVKDIYPDLSGSFPEEMVAVGAGVYFQAEDGENGRELWKSDGTAVGTVLVKNLTGNNNSSSPKSLYNFNGTVFFSAQVRGTGDELYKSDGTSEGTVLVKDINEGVGDSEPESFIDAGGVLFFRAFLGLRDRKVLYKTDGTEAGTVPVRGPTQLKNGSIEFNDRLYFIGDISDGTGNELWTSDGTDVGTFRVKDINPTPFIGGMTGALNLGRFVVLGDSMFFAANEGENGFELWKSDGTEAGTVLVADINPGASGSLPTNFVVLGDKIAFTAEGGLSGKEWWTSNGTAEGTQFVADINPKASNRSEFTVVGDMIYFPALQPDTGMELWRSDGTEAGTTLVADVLAGPGSSDPDGIAERNGDIFFVARDGVHGRELWKHSPSAGTTEMLADINTTGDTFTIAPFALPYVFLVTAGNTTFFVADDGATGAELWKTDGTPAGTALVQDTFVGPDPSSPSEAIVVNGVLYFVATDAEHGAELRRSDGTDAGTTVVKDIYPGPTSANPLGLAQLNGVLYFPAISPEFGLELWRSDGTEAGTTLVKDITPGIRGGVSPVSVAAGQLFFRASDLDRGQEVWISDGTEVGTDILLDILDPGSSDPSPLQVVNDRIFFSADDGISGREPWTSDGVTTVRLGDINPGEGDSVVGVINPGVGDDVNLRFTRFEPYGSMTIFPADDGENTELWQTDGTPGGTSKLFTEPDVVVAGEYLYYTTGGGDTGTPLQLMAVRPPGAAELVDDLGTEDLGTPLIPVGNRLFYIVFEVGDDGKAASVLRVAVPEDGAKAFVGGTVEGIQDGGSQRNAACRNAAREQVVEDLIGNAWDCEAMGLELQSGERVVMRLRVTAAGDTVDGSASGVDPTLVQCRNRTSGQRVRQPLNNAEWSCAAVGLEVNPGDEVTVWIVGRVL